MKTKCIAIAMLGLLALSFSESARSQVIVNLIPPPSPYKWNIVNFWNLTLTNTSQEKLEVYLFGWVEAMGEGVIFEGTSAVIQLPPLFSGRINPLDLQPAEMNYVNSGYEEIVMRTGTMPSGTYTICIVVKSAATGDELGKNCMVQPILNASPPELVYPADLSQVTDPFPVFSWLPPTPYPVGEQVSYRMDVAELYDGQGPVDAMGSNPFYFTTKGINTTSLQWPLPARALEPGKDYAWRITAYGKGYEIGVSPVWSFTYGQEEKRCDLYNAKIEKVFKRDTCYYKLTIVNNYQGTSVEYTPAAFRIRIKQDSISSVLGEIPKGWSRIPGKMPPRSTFLTWKSKSGTIHRGEINLGLIYLGNAVAAPNYFISEWLNRNDTIICKDSLQISMPIEYYYDLSEEFLDNPVTIASDTLNVQYMNRYASIAFRDYAIYDMDEGKPVPGTKEKRQDGYSLNGLNRFSVSLKEYKLSPDKTYLLTVTDKISSYYLFFKIISQNEK